MGVSDLILNIAMFGCFSSAQLKGVVVDYEGRGGSREMYDQAAYGIEDRIQDSRLR